MRTRLAPIIEPGDAPTLRSLCADLGHELVSVLAAPQGLDVPVAQTVFYDPRDPPPVRTNDLVLAAGIDPCASAGLDLIDVAAQANACGVVVKRTDPVAGSQAMFTRHARVALLEARRGVGWAELAALIRSSVSTAEAAAIAFEPAPGSDLFDLADALAAALGGPVTIEDRQSRVLAFSNLDAPLDAGRQETILRRAVPRHWVERLREAGVAREILESDHAVHVEFPGEGAPRRAIAVRADGLVLGSIWVAQGIAPLPPETDQALEQAARVAALHMLRLKLSVDFDRRTRTEAVRAALQGKVPLTALALPEHEGLMVLAVKSIDSAGSHAATDGHGRVLALLMACFDSLGRPADGATLGDTTYLIVACGRTRSREQLVQLADEALSTASRMLKLNLCAGLGSQIPALADVLTSRSQAEQALGVGRKLGINGVIDIEAFAAPALLLEVDAFLARQHRPLSAPLRSLLALDRERGTDYIRTLRAYLDCFGDSAAAAERLHVHANTVRYRMRRLAEVVDLDFTRVEDRLGIELQLRCLMPPSPGDEAGDQS